MTLPSVVVVAGAVLLDVVLTLAVTRLVRPPVAPRRERSRPRRGTPRLSHVWGYQHDPGSNVVDVYVGCAGWATRCSPEAGARAARSRRSAFRDAGEECVDVDTQR